jgi:hypothetical protein
MRRGADRPPSRLPALLGIAILAVTILVLALFLTLRPWGPADLVGGGLHR